MDRLLACRMLPNTLYLRLSHGQLFFRCEGPVLDGYLGGNVAMVRL